MRIAITFCMLFLAEAAYTALRSPKSHSNSNHNIMALSPLLIEMHGNARGGQRSSEASDSPTNADRARNRVINACPVDELFVDILPSSGSAMEHSTVDTVILVVGRSLTPLPQVFAKMNNDRPPVFTMEVNARFRPPFLPVVSHFFSCTDRRADYPGLFTPGGDLGEFINVLASIEDSSESRSIRLSHSDVASLLNGYLESMHESGKEVFYACTDDKALLRLAKAAAVVDPLAPRSRLELERLLQLVDEPQFIGSNHIRSMLQDSQGYGVREDIVRHAITCFMRIRLDEAHPLHSKTILGSMRSNVDEDSNDANIVPFIEILRTKSKNCPEGKMVFEEECTSYPCGLLAPLVDPARAAFVVHVSDIEIYRASLAEHFLPKIPAGDENSQTDLTVEAFYLNLLGRGSAATEITRKRFFHDMPRYQVSFHGKKH